MMRPRIVGDPAEDPAQQTSSTESTTQSPFIQFPGGGLAKPQCFQVGRQKDKNVKKINTNANPCMAGTLHATCALGRLRVGEGRGGENKAGWNQGTWRGDLRLG